MCSGGATNGMQELGQADLHDARRGPGPRDRRDQLLQVVGERLFPLGLQPGGALGQGPLLKPAQEVEEGQCGGGNDECGDTEVCGPHVSHAFDSRRQNPSVCRGYADASRRVISLPYSW